jgi:hypothetical protein
MTTKEKVKPTSQALKWAQVIAKFSQNRIEAAIKAKKCKNFERATVTAFEQFKADIVLQTKGPDVDARRASVISNPDMVEAQKKLDEAYAKGRTAQLNLDTWTAACSTIHELNALVVAGLLTSDEAVALVEPEPEEKPEPPKEVAKETAKGDVVIGGIKWIDGQKEGAQ